MGFSVTVVGCFYLEGEEEIEIDSMATEYWTCDAVHGEICFVSPTGKSFFDDVFEDLKSMVKNVWASGLEVCGTCVIVGENHERVDKIAIKLGEEPKRETVEFLI